MKHSISGLLILVLMFSLNTPAIATLGPASELTEGQQGGNNQGIPVGGNTFPKEVNEALEGKAEYFEDEIERQKIEGNIPELVQTTQELEMEATYQDVTAGRPNDYLEDRQDYKYRKSDNPNKIIIYREWESYLNGRFTNEDGESGFRKLSAADAGSGENSTSGRQDPDLPFSPFLRELFEFIEREEEFFRKVDLKDKFSASGLKLNNEEELELKLESLIDKAVSAIESEDFSALDVIVLDWVEFTDQIRAIHKLLNPPDRLDPLLKWLLYLSRVTPEMIELYQAALEKRDRIFLLAARSKGKLKIRLNGKILQDALYAWPDQKVRYELVMTPTSVPQAPPQPPVS